MQQEITNTTSSGLSANPVWQAIATINDMQARKATALEAFTRFAQATQGKGFSRTHELTDFDTNTVPDEVAAMASEYGNTAKPWETASITALQYPRPEMGSSGMVAYTDKRTGEVNILLIRQQRGTLDQWEFPAGFMSSPPDVKEGSENVPSLDALRATVNSHYESLLEQHGWREAKRQTQNPDTLRHWLSENPNTANTPNKWDVNDRENYMRELREETGLDVQTYPNAHTWHVDTYCNLISSGGGHHAMIANPHFVTYLGELDTPPELRTNGQEANEHIHTAAWVPLKAIIKHNNKSYTIDQNQLTYSTAPLPAGTPQTGINIYTIPIMEESLGTLLNERIRQASHPITQDNAVAGSVARSTPLFSAAENVRAAVQPGTQLPFTLRLKQSDVLASVQHSNIDRDGHLDTLAGAEGQARFNAFVTIAATLARPDPLQQRPESEGFVQQIFSPVRRVIGM